MRIGDKIKARRDLDAYDECFQRNDLEGMLSIEEAWGLDGYPPNIVQNGLAAVASGKDLDVYLDELMS